MSLFKRQKELLGQVLVERGIITPEQLDKAIQIQKEQGGLIGDILTNLGFASEEDIVQAVSIQHDVPYLPLVNYEIDPELIKSIPENLARKYDILPVDKMGDILTIVMANPLDKKAIDEIETLTKCKIEVFVSTYREIREAIERVYVQK
jgi:type IV pilus assembly protein PilB